MQFPSLLTGVPEALMVRFAPRPYDTMRSISRLLGEEPRSAGRER